MMGSLWTLNWSFLVGEDDELFTDYDHVLAFFKWPIRDLHKYLDLLLEFIKQMHGHIMEL